MNRWSLTLLACLAGCASGVHGESTAYSNASLVGKYRMTSTLKPYVKFAGGPKVSEGDVIFDGQGNLSGRLVFWGDAATVRGIYQIQPDGTGELSMITALQDGSTSESALTLQIQNDHQIEFVSDGLRESRDWMSVQSLITHGQAAFQGILEKE
jgi:hypothetical protein